MTDDDLVERVARAVRWRMVERKYCFDVMCERPAAHITVEYGDSSHNIPRFGTKDQARADAELITMALNERDASTAASDTIRRKAREHHEKLLRDDPGYRKQWEEVTTLFRTVWSDAELITKALNERDADDR